MRSRRKLGALLLAPAGCWVMFLGIAPLALVVYLSLCKYSPGSLYLRTFTLENYLRFIRDPFYWGVVWRTLRISMISTILCALLGYPVAYHLARSRSRWKGILTFLVVVPLMVGTVVRTYGWLILLGSEGIISRVLHWLHLIREPVSFLYTEGAVVTGIVGVLLPFMVMPLTSSIQKISVFEEEAAIILGASPAKTFARVVLPRSLPGLTSGALLVLTLALGAFATPLFLGGPKHTMATVLIWQQMLAVMNWPLGSATSVLVMLVTLVVVGACLRLAHSLQRARRV